MEFRLGDSLRILVGWRRLFRNRRNRGGLRHVWFGRFTHRAVRLDFAVGCLRDTLNFWDGIERHDLAV